jgi:olfactory receptor
MILAGLLKGDKVMTYNACAAQMFFFVVFATVECYLFASMAYHCYVAVNKPLHYTITMTSVCECLVIGCYICGLLNPSIHTADIFSLSSVSPMWFITFSVIFQQLQFSLALIDMLVSWFLFM